MSWVCLFILMIDLLQTHYIVNDPKRTEGNLVIARMLLNYPERRTLIVNVYFAGVLAILALFNNAYVWGGVALLQAFVVTRNYLRGVRFRPPW